MDGISATHSSHLLDRSDRIAQLKQRLQQISQSKDIKLDKKTATLINSLLHSLQTSLNKDSLSSLFLTSSHVIELISHMQNVDPEFISELDLMDRKKNIKQYLFEKSQPIKIPYASSIAIEKTSALGTSEPLTKQDLIHMLTAMLEDGIDNMDELTQVIAILKKLGLNIPLMLMKKVEEAIADFLAIEADKATDLMDFLNLLSTVVNKLDSVASADVVDEFNLEAILESKFEEEFKQSKQALAAAEVAGLNIDIVSDENNEDSLSELSDNKADNKELAERLAGTQHAKQAPLGQTKEGEKSSTLQADAIKPVFRLVSATLHDFMQAKKADMCYEVLDVIEKYVAKTLNQALDKAIDTLDPSTLDSIDTTKKGPSLTI